jgi:hypothetical protein
MSEHKWNEIMYDLDTLQAYRRPTRYEPKGPKPSKRLPDRCTTSTYTRSSKKNQLV